MQLSARNQLNGKITNVELGAVMANIKIEISEPNTITAVITKESSEKLGLSDENNKCRLFEFNTEPYDGEYEEKRGEVSLTSLLIGVKLLTFFVFIVVYWRLVYDLFSVAFHFLTE